MAVFHPGFEAMEVVEAMHQLLRLGGATPTARTVRSGAARLHVLEQGSGPPLLLLHGGGGGGANWYRVLPSLAAEFRVLAPDLPGFGLSEDVAPAPPLGRQAAGILVELLDALEIPRVSVLGTSFGGLAALRLAQHFPGRVDRLVLLDSAGLTTGVPALVRLAALPVIGGAALRPSEAGMRWLLRSLLTSSPLAPGHETALVQYLLAVARAHRATASPALRAFCGWRGQRERCEAGDLGSIRAPTLVLWGERDRFFPVEQVRRAMAAFPGATLTVIEGVGHSPNWEAPHEVVEKVRRFLAADHGC